MSILARGVVLAVESLVRLLLGVYFRRIEIFHAERVPASPVLFVANHPGSITDAFIVGISLPRRAHFLATAQLFRLKPVAWLLHHCGVIPLNRVQDDPAAMRSVANSFDAAFRVLERGEAVVIFPEGVTYDDAQLKALKSGAARLALELEHRHGGRLGLQIVPLGLTYSAKEKFRSDVLVFSARPFPSPIFSRNTPRAARSASRVSPPRLNAACRTCSSICRKSSASTPSRRSSASTSSGCGTATSSSRAPFPRSPRRSSSPRPSSTPWISPTASCRSGCPPFRPVCSVTSICCAGCIFRMRRWRKSRPTVTRPRASSAGVRWRCCFPSLPPSAGCTGGCPRAWSRPGPPVSSTRTNARRRRPTHACSRAW
ncbi:MAG: hypothetical protein EXS42_06820 [Lacunisphaera sp.]|nr:hypothetical protein [Lacunisphaera sp.]